MATVYKAQHVELRSLHALKIIQTTDEEAQERALAEARAQAALRHPNVLQISDLLRTDKGWPVLVLEYVEGDNLAQHLQRRRLSVDEIDHIAEGLLQGVGAAHAAGLVHRDLKPSNVLLSTKPDGSVRPLVADFGIAKIRGSLWGGTPTQTGIMMGTPGYASPEQMVSARDVDQVSDIFSLGALLYCLVTSRLAFPQKDRLELLRCITSARYRPVKRLRPDAPDRMVRAIELALRPERGRRVSSVRRLLQVWRGERAVGVEPLTAPPLLVVPEVVATVNAPARLGEAPEQRPPVAQPSPEETPRSLAAPLTWVGDRARRRRRVLWALPALGVLAAFAVLGVGSRDALTVGADGGSRGGQLQSAGLMDAEASARGEGADSETSGQGELARDAAPEVEPARPEAQVALAGSSKEAQPARASSSPSARGGSSAAPTPASPLQPEPARVTPSQATAGVAARPALIIRQIEAEPDPAPPSGYGRIHLSEGGTGYAESTDGARHALPGALPPGAYDIYVYFEGSDATRVGRRDLQAKQVVTMRCAAAMRSCR